MIALLGDMFLSQTMDTLSVIGRAALHETPGELGIRVKGVVSRLGRAGSRRTETNTILRTVELEK